MGFDFIKEASARLFLGRTGLILETTPQQVSFIAGCLKGIHKGGRIFLRGLENCWWDWAAPRQSMVYCFPRFQILQVASYLLLKHEAYSSSDPGNRSSSRNEEQFLQQPVPELDMGL